MKKGIMKSAYENLTFYNSITKTLEDSDKLKRANIVGVNLELYKRKVDTIENEKNLQL
jgi:hypothetical protein